MLKGRCECGAVAFEVHAPHETVTFCHCSQCRRTSGHHWAATHTPRDQLVFTNQAGLKWYQSSDWARRGFCGECGSSLFYDMKADDTINVAAGCLNTPTGLRPGKHIFTADKGDYYEIAADAPHIAQY